MSGRHSTAGSECVNDDVEASVGSRMDERRTGLLDCVFELLAEMCHIGDHVLYFELWDLTLHSLIHDGYLEARNGYPFECIVA
jgi:hypothetical protein